MAYTIRPRRCGIATHILLACLAWTIVVNIPTSIGESGDLCRFCSCTSTTHLSCIGVFREGSILERLATEENITHLNVAWPPTKLSSELFEEHRNVSCLYLSNNDIASLDDNFFFSYRYLVFADLSHNAFRKIPNLGNNTFLKTLVLRANAIQDVSKNLRFGAPNVSSLTLSVNSVKVLHGSHLPQRLTFLSLHKNKIVALGQDALEGLNLLRIVDLSYNNISFISSHALSLPSLTSIHLLYNRIAVIQPSAFPKGVFSLGLSGNRLHNLSFLEGLHSLKSLNFMNRYDIYKFTSVPKFPDLRTLKATNIRNPEIVNAMLSKSPVLNNMLVTNGHLMQVAGLNHSKLLHLDLNSNRIASIGKTFLLPSLQILQLRNNRLISLPNVTGFLYLKVLDVTRNKIAALKEDDLLNLPRLNQIHLDHNRIISADGHNKLLINLNIFSATHNQIPDLLHFIVPKLTYLDLDGNKMKQFSQSVIGRMSINFLTLNENEIDVIRPESFHDMVVLKTLSMTYNKITQIRELPLFPELISLTLDNNPLQFIGARIFLSLPKLGKLSLKCTQITSMPDISGIFPFMKTIYLQKNALVEFPINMTYNFPNTHTLNLNDNMINHWHSGMLTPLKHLRNLFISNNPIKAFDIDTAFRANLSSIALGSTSTDSIHPCLLKSIAKIRNVELQGSHSVRIQDDFFCISEITNLGMDGVNFDRINSSCSMSLTSSLTLSNVQIKGSLLDMIISWGKTIVFRNVSLTEHGQLGNNRSIVFVKELKRLSYTNSRLSQVPRILAPSASHLNLSGNHLTTFCFGTMAKLFPSLVKLSLANNRIRVLSSCGLRSIHHPLRFMYLDGNHLGRFSHWTCEDGLVFLRALSDVDLSSNNISILKEVLLPPSLLGNKYALKLYSYNNPHICTCDQRWLIGVKDTVEVIGGQCVAPRDNKGKELSDLMDTDFPCKPSLISITDRICTIAANNTILVKCPALAYPNPVIKWRLQESQEAEDSIGLFTNLSGRGSNCRNTGVEQLELTLADRIYGEGEQNVLFSLTCFASNMHGLLAIDVSVNITYHDVVRAPRQSLRGVNQRLSVQCHASGRNDEGGGCADGNDTVKHDVNRSSRMKSGEDETSGYLTLFCCLLLHMVSKLMIY